MTPPSSSARPSLQATVILAQARSDARRLVAKAEADAVRTVAAALPGVPDPTQYLVGLRYIGGRVGGGGRLVGEAGYTQGRLNRAPLSVVPLLLLLQRPCSASPVRQPAARSSCRCRLTSQGASEP